MNTRHIWTDPKRYSGFPCIRGYRFPISQLLAELADRGTIKSVAEDFGFSCDEVAGVLQDLAEHFDRTIDSP